MLLICIHYVLFTLHLQMKQRFISTWFKIANCMHFVGFVCFLFCHQSHRWLKEREKMIQRGITMCKHVRCCSDHIWGGINKKKMKRNNPRHTANNSPSFIMVWFVSHSVWFGMRLAHSSCNIFNRKIDDHHTPSSSSSSSTKTLQFCTLQCKIAINCEDGNGRSNSTLFVMGLKWKSSSFSGYHNTTGLISDSTGNMHGVSSLHNHI